MTHEKSLGLESESMESHLLTKYVIERKGDQHPNTSIPPFQTQDYERVSDAFTWFPPEDYWWERPPKDATEGHLRGSVG